jgi:hypothetical protein
VKAHELQEKALRLLEIAKTTMNPSHRQGLMDVAFEFVNSTAFPPLPESELRRVGLRVGQRLGASTTDPVG